MKDGRGTKIQKLSESNAGVQSDILVHLHHKCDLISHYALDQIREPTNCVPRSAGR